MVAVTPRSAEQIPSWGDVALAGSLLGVAVLSGFFIDANRPDTVEPSSLWQWLLIATPPALVAFRRLDPVLVTVLATIAQASIWISDLPEVLLPIIVILYSAASDAGRRGIHVAVGASVVLTIVTGIGVRIADDVTLYQLPLIMLTCGTAIVLGANAARQRELAARLAMTVTETRLRSQHEKERAIGEERSHIARELHDIIGHTLTVIAVRAEAADRVGARQPEAAGEAVVAIAGAARSALNETRRVLAGLRDSSTVDLTPPADLSGIRRLVSDLAETGTHVQLTEVGCDGFALPAVAAGGAHRIVQESLTNAIRHGAQAEIIEVAITCGSSGLEIRITNGVDHQGSASRPADAGSGLVGMAERAAVLGGTFDARRVEDRFIVEVTLPAGPGIQEGAAT